MRGSQLHIGCCGWALPQRQYFATFPVLEVQQTFYEPPRLVTLEKWRTASPPGFEFTLKAWQLITHEPFSPTYRRLKTPVPEAKRSNYGAFRPTDEVYAAWRATLACARALNARIIVFQCPAAFGPTAQHTGNLRRFFLSAGKEADDLTFAWEPRGDWNDAQVKQVCEELGLVHVVDPFARKTVTSGLRYYRLHGIGGYRYTYSDTELARLATCCDGESYVMFNNFTMAQDALRFAETCR
ncbi:MAG TPA: DUF72 domain-containing protein [Burkholderiales bacterium]|nr:DUF72 domain-containing protein [Burkholderiales bacterium]